MNPIARHNASIAENPARASAMQQAVAIILEEHRSLRIVLQMMKLAVSGVSGRGAACDCEPFTVMLQYIRTFPDKLHHPKEEDYLFERLQFRTQKYDDVIGELRAQHASDDRWLQKLERSLQQFEAGFPPAFEVFRTTLATYCEYELQHMNLEESVIIPAARECLTEDDWKTILAAFMNNGDSRFDPSAEKTCSILYSRIGRLPFDVAAAAPGLMDDRHG